MSRPEHSSGEDHPAEESAKTADEREVIGDALIKEIAEEMSRDTGVQVEALSAAASRGIEELQPIERQQAEADGEQKLRSAEEVIAAPGDKPGGEIKDVPQLQIIIDRLNQIVADNKELKEAMQQTRCQRFLNVMGVVGTLVTVAATIWGFLYAYSSSASVSSRAFASLGADGSSPREELLTILKAWQSMSDTVWWQLVSHYLRTNPDLTINDHMVFLQYTMFLSPMGGIIWDSYQDQLDIVNKLIQFYKKGGVYISDIYLEITKPDYYYQGAALPRATAANILLLTLGSILVENLPVKRATPRTPQDEMIIAAWDSKTTPGSGSAWMQKDAQVRYAVTYVRNDNESLRMWTDWSYVEKGRSRPTLQSIPTPGEQVDSMRLYRQFGVAARGQQPPDKGIIVLIQKFSAATGLPNSYQDVTPAPRSTLSIVLDARVATQPPRQAPRALMAPPRPMGSHAGFHSSRSILRSSIEAKSMITISDDTSDKISLALDIVGTLAWAQPEIAPFINADIMLAKWIFGIGSSGTDFGPVIAALGQVEKDIIGFVQGALDWQHLENLASRIQTYARWMSNSAKILNDLQSEADPVTHAMNAILQNQGILEELRAMTTPENGSLYDVIQKLLDDPDFALPDASSPQPYTDYAHFERVKTKYKFLILGISVYVTSLKTQIMLQRFVKQNINSVSSNPDLDDTDTYTTLYVEVRGSTGFYNRVRTDVDLSSSTSIFPAVIARRQAMISGLYGASYRTSELPAWIYKGDVYSNDDTPCPPDIWNRSKAFGSLGYPGAVTVFNTDQSPRYFATIAATPNAAIRLNMQDNFLNYNLGMYGSYFKDSCWEAKDADFLVQSYAVPDSSTIFPDPEGGYYANCTDRPPSWGDHCKAYTDELTQKTKSWFGIQNNEGDLVINTWLDAVAAEDGNYQPTTPAVPMSLTAWADAGGSDGSAWFQSNVQVRYAWTYMRKGGGESEKRWTDWCSVPSGKKNPTLGIVPPPDDEKVDCIWIYRQFGVAADGQPPDDSKTPVRPIKALIKDKTLGNFPSSYQDITPAPVALLGSGLSLMTLRSTSNRSSRHSELKTTGLFSHRPAAQTSTRSGSPLTAGGAQRAKASVSTPPPSHPSGSSSTTEPPVVTIHQPVSQTVFARSPGQAAESAKKKPHVADESTESCCVLM